MHVYSFVAKKWIALLYNMHICIMSKEVREMSRARKTVSCALRRVCEHALQKTNHLHIHGASIYIIYKFATTGIVCVWLMWTSSRLRRVTFCTRHARLVSPRPHWPARRHQRRHRSRECDRTIWRDHHISVRYLFVYVYTCLREKGTFVICI